MAQKKRVHNTKTGKYYKRQERQGKYKRGQIRGSWKQPKNEKKKSFWDRFK